MLFQVSQMMEVRASCLWRKLCCLVMSPWIPFSCLSFPREMTPTNDSAAVIAGSMTWRSESKTPLENLIQEAWSFPHAWKPWHLGFHGPLEPVKKKVRNKSLLTQEEKGSYTAALGSLQPRGQKGAHKSLTPEKIKAEKWLENLLFILLEFDWSKLLSMLTVLENI